MHPDASYDDLNTEWRLVLDRPDNYCVSNTGLIWSIKRGRVLKTQVSANGYERFNYYVPSGYKQRKQAVLLVHRLVAAAFIPNPERKLYVNHKDGNKLNNQASNLEWVTQPENMDHARGLGLWEPSGEGNPNASLSVEDVQVIRAKYKPKVYSMYKLADEYGVTPQAIFRIIHEYGWTHI